MIALMKVGAIAGLCAALSGQPFLEFDVAAIHPDMIGASAGTSFNLFDGGRLHVTNATLQFLIGNAYHIQSDQIIGGPAWLDSDRYDIDAKPAMPQDITREQLRDMLQHLLADRFQLKFHRETRERTVYALVIGKNGPRLKDHDGEPGSSLNTHTESGKVALTGTNASLDQLAVYLGNKLGRVVLDKTGLHGAYDFTFEWDPEQAADSATATMFTGLQEQLGLRLETQKSAVEVLVVDKAEKASQN